MGKSKDARTRQEQRMQKRAKQIAKQPRHTDKYAHRVMESKLDQLVAHFNGPEGERR